jgi:hypothetical protein
MLVRRFRPIQIVPFAKPCRDLLGEIPPFPRIAERPSCRGDCQHRPPKRRAIDRHLNPCGGSADAGRGLGWSTPGPYRCGRRQANHRSRHGQWIGSVGLPLGRRDVARRLGERALEFCSFQLRVRGPCAAFAMSRPTPITCRTLLPLPLHHGIKPRALIPALGAAGASIRVGLDDLPAACRRSPIGVGARAYGLERGVRDWATNATHSRRVRVPSVVPRP